MWSKDIRKERKLNIYNVLIESSLLYGAETWRLTENNKRRVEATEIVALRRSSKISRKDKIRKINIRQQIGLEETIIKEIEQTAHMVWPCSKNKAQKTFVNSNTKNKAVPLQVWSGPESSGSYVSQISRQRHRMMVMLSATRTGRLYCPGNTPGTNFC